MDWQQIASLVIVAGTVVLLVAREIRRKRQSVRRACSGGCDCGGKQDWKQVEGSVTHSQ